MASAARSASAAIVSVGFAVPAVGNTPLPSKFDAGDVATLARAQIERL
jgi:hypothetical protein